MINNKFTKTQPSLYKLTNKQIVQVIDYLKCTIHQEELNDAIGYTYNCPYCNSKDIYKTKQQSHLYRFQCESCKKKFTNLSKSAISKVLKEEYVNQNQRFNYQKSLKDIEVWLYFDIKNDRYKKVPRKNLISTMFRWKHRMIQMPKDLKEDHLVNIHERDRESFYRLLDNQQFKINRKEKRLTDNRKFIILEFQEGKFTSKESFDNLSDQFMRVDYNPFKNYQDELKKK